MLPCLTSRHTQTDRQLKAEREGSDQRKEVDEEISVVSYDVESATTQVDKQLESLPGLVSAVDHIRHVRCQHERSAITNNHITVVTSIHTHYKICRNTVFFPECKIR